MNAYDQAASYVADSLKQSYSLNETLEYKILGCIGWPHIENDRSAGSIHKSYHRESNYLTSTVRNSLDVEILIDCMIANLLLRMIP
jgi:hypothetical protein